MSLCPADYRIDSRQVMLQNVMEALQDGEVDYPRSDLSYSTMTHVIEHILLQLPLLPCFYIQRSPSNIKCILTGSALIETLKRFTGPEQFKLCWMTSFPEMEGMSFMDLRPHIRRRIKETRWDTYYSILHEPIAAEMEVDLTQRFQGMFRLFQD